MPPLNINVILSTQDSPDTIQINLCCAPCNDQCFVFNKGDVVKEFRLLGTESSTDFIVPNATIVGRIDEGAEKCVCNRPRGGILNDFLIQWLMPELVD